MLRLNEPSARFQLRGELKFGDPIQIEAVRYLQLLVEVREEGGEIECSECDGEGVVECGECGHDKECEECDGCGSEFYDVPRKFDARQLWLFPEMLAWVNDSEFSARVQ